MIKKYTSSCLLIFLISSSLHGLYPQAVTGGIYSAALGMINSVILQGVSTPDSTKAYLAFQGTVTVDPGLIGVDVATNTLLGAISASFPFTADSSIAMTPDGTKMYIGNAADPLNLYAILNTGSSFISASITPGIFLTNDNGRITITPDGTKAYITNQGIPYPTTTGDKIAIIDVATDTATGYVSDPSSLLKRPMAIAITPDGKTAYACNLLPAPPIVQNFRIVIIDVATDTVTGMVPINTSFPLVTPGIVYIVINPSGTRAYAAIGGSGGTIRILDLTKNPAVIIGSINNPTTVSTRGLVISPDGSTLYRAGPTYIDMFDLTQDTPTFISTVNNSLFNTDLYGIAIAADGKKAYSIFDGASSAIAVLSYYQSPAGPPDRSFANQGFALTPVSTADSMNGITTQTDNKIVVTGATQTTNSRLFLARYTSDGVLDTTFNSGGSTPGTQIFTATGSKSTGNAVIMQDDGKIVVVGFVVEDQTKLLVARYTTAGVLDTTFNGTGYNAVSIGTGATANAMFIDSGLITVAGSSVINGIPNFILAQFDSTGALVPSFGTGGIATTEIGTNASITTITRNPFTGAITVIGNANNQITIARYDTGGSLDPSFGVAGIAQPNIGSPAIARGGFQAFITNDPSPDYRIVVVGSTYLSRKNQSLIMQLDNAGNLDTSFNTVGYNITPIAYGSGFNAGFFNIIFKTPTLVSSPIVQRNYIAVGYGIGALSNQLCIAQYLDNGTLDTSFGTNGIVLTALGDDASVQAVTMQTIAPYGIITGGVTDGTFCVGRYSPTL